MRYSPFIPALYRTQAISPSQEKSFRIQQSPQQIFQRRSPVLHAADYLQCALPFRRRRRTAQCRQVKFLDDLRVRLAGLEQSTDAVIGITQHLVDQRASDELERLVECRVLGALALAAEQADRLTERSQELLAV